METTHIYTLSDPNTGLVRYVGKANKVNVRINQHISLSKIPRTHKHSWIKSLLDKGKAPVVDIIDMVPIECWKFWEEHYIKLFKSVGANLTNMTNGGDGRDMTEELREKIRANTEGKKHNVSEEGRKAIKKNLPQVPWNKNKKASYELRQKLRESHLGIYPSPESLIKKSISLKKVIRTKEWNAKIALALSKNKKPIYQLTKDGILICEWESATDVEKKLGYSRKNINQVCRGKRKYANGFIWKYKNIESCQ